MKCHFFHSLALTQSGEVYIWGISTDQLIVDCTELWPKKLNEFHPDIMWSFSSIGNDNIYCYLCNKTLIGIIEEIKSDSNLKKDKTLTTIGYIITSQLFIEILESVHYLHQNNIIHSCSQCLKKKTIEY
jgi:hypothetical protein